MSALAVSQGILQARHPAPQCLHLRLRRNHRLRVHSPLGRVLLPQLLLLSLAAPNAGRSRLCAAYSAAVQRLQLNFGGCEVGFQLGVLFGEELGGRGERPLGNLGSRPFTLHRRQHAERLLRRVRRAPEGVVGRRQRQAEAGRGDECRAAAPRTGGAPRAAVAGHAVRRVRTVIRASRGQPVTAPVWGQRVRPCQGSSVGRKGADPTRQRRVLYVVPVRAVVKFMLRDGRRQSAHTGGPAYEASQHGDRGSTVSHRRRLRHLRCGSHMRACAVRCGRRLGQCAWRQRPPRGAPNSQNDGFRLAETQRDA